MKEQNKTNKTKQNKTNKTCHSLSDTHAHTHTHARTAAMDGAPLQARVLSGEGRIVVAGRRRDARVPSSGVAGTPQRPNDATTTTAASKQRRLAEAMSPTPLSPDYKGLLLHFYKTFIPDKVCSARADARERGFNDLWCACAGEECTCHPQEVRRHRGRAVGVFGEEVQEACVFSRCSTRPSLAVV